LHHLQTTTPSHNLGRSKDEAKIASLPHHPTKAKTNTPYHNDNKKHPPTT